MGLITALAATVLAQPTVAARDLSHLNDEFNSAATLGQWARHHDDYGWPDQARVLNINTSSPGHLYIEPEVSSWFQDYRGVYLSKEVTGNFRVTTRVWVTGLNTDLPQADFTLAGLMVRTPREPGAWTPGGENWLFITTGRGTNGTTPQIERKTTVNSQSTLVLSPGRFGWVELRIERRGAEFTLWRRYDGEAWVLHHTYMRPDMPETVQVGLHSYTDWPTTGAYPGGAPAFNQVIVPSPPGNRDMIVRYDWIRFAGL
ncbi:MAG: hypothetical protein H6811_09830 [Phycisphaeraceae bacterium]|nr:hypothetical protein [Phycisphaeraceae bacterium]